MNSWPSAPMLMTSAAKGDADSTATSNSGMERVMVLNSPRGGVSKGLPNAPSHIEP